MSRNKKKDLGSLDLVSFRMLETSLATQEKIFDDKEREMRSRGFESSERRHRKNKNLCIKLKQAIQEKILEIQKEQVKESHNSAKHWRGVLANDKLIRR